MRSVWLCLMIVGACGGDDSGVPPGGAACTRSVECATGEVCIAGSCGLPGSQPVGSACSASRDCVDGLWCAPTPLGSVCQPAGTGVVGDPCVSGAECMGGLRCDLYGFGGACAEAGSGEHGDACLENADCLAGLYCGVEATCNPFGNAFPPYAGADCPEAQGEYRVFFEIPRPGQPPLDFFRLPFPNDIRVNADGTLDLSDFPRPGPTPLGVDLVDLYADTWSADFEGFGATAAVLFRFSEEIAFSTTELDGSIRFVDVTPAAPEFGAELGLSWSYTTGRNKFTCPNPLTVRNDVVNPLTPGHTYAVILSRAIRSQAGSLQPVQDADFATVIGSTRPGEEALARAWDAYGPLRDVLPVLGIAPADVAAAAVFTVQDTTGLMRQVAADLATQPAPILSDLVLCDAGVVSPCDDGTPQHACGAAQAGYHEIHGRFSVPIYQAGTAPYLTPADGGGIPSPPAPQRTEEICFVMTVPKASMPAGGWPLMVHHHGTGGSARGFVGSGIAETMATASSPSAVFGFDAVLHGSRRGGSTRDPDELVFNPLNPHAARDNFLQGAVDILQALRVAGLTLDVAASPTGEAIAFDATRVSFFGHSQGATSGALAMAFSDDAPATIFSGAGSFLTASLLEKTSPIDIKAGLDFLLGEPVDGSHPMMTLFQSWYERSDPINYNVLILRAPPVGTASKHVFMSYGTGDTYTPATTLNLTALSLGIPPVAPVLSDFGPPAVSRPVSQNRAGGDGGMRTAAVFQYDPSGYDGHFVATDNPSAVMDWRAYLTSWLATGTPTVP